MEPNNSSCSPKSQSRKILTRIEIKNKNIFRSLKVYKFSQSAVKSNNLTSVFLCVWPVVDHEFHHNIVNVAVDARGDSRVDPQYTLTM